ncbi:MAG TPA: hypothetical protein VE593_01440 [Nitrososphaeraceae archaeon]|nr:hypothetical protein [Nitrososphaeraceae archaeon]
MENNVVTAFEYPFELGEVYHDILTRQYLRVMRIRIIATSYINGISVLLSLIKGQLFVTIEAIISKGP